MEKIEFRPSAMFKLHELMQDRVYEILLVASPYDAYIMEEDGQLTEQILTEYLGLNFTSAPRVWREDSALSALEIIGKRKFDLVIVMARISDMDPFIFGKKVKELFPKKPVILLAADESEIAHLDIHAKNSGIDKIFMWTGHADVFPAIIKFIEDKQNARRDVQIGDVGIIILIEDTPRDYSNILPLIYKVLVGNTNHLISKSLNAAQRLLHLRGRPKILLTSNYENAQKLYRRYSGNVIGIISDINFPRKGKKDPMAGIKIAKWARKYNPVMPIMLQSRDEDVRELAHEINAHFLFKESTRLLHDIEEFIIKNFGFGDFIFRMPDSKEISRAGNLAELIHELKTIPDESLLYHAAHNHFSTWLSARSEFELASKIRPWGHSDFTSIPEHRKAIIDVLTERQSFVQTRQIQNFAVDNFDPAANFVRLVQGSLGGKARGLAFAGKMLSESEISKDFPDIAIRIPYVAFVGTDEFDSFMTNNNLWEKALALKNNNKINSLFLKASLSHELVNSLAVYLSKINHPLAVRSSSLLEDSPYQPLAGMYATYMFPNNGKTLNSRVVALSNLIKLVYASMFHIEPRAMLKNSAHRLEEEKMAVVLQELVGEKHGFHYYPNFSGVAHSNNYYPVSYMKREEGVAFVALGLGRTVVEGEQALRFSPRYPAILPQFYSVKATISSSQNSFYALNLGELKHSGKTNELSGIDKLPLSHAENDGTLKSVASVVAAEDSVIRDSLSYDGIRVITFAPVLKWKLFPLADLLERLLAIGKSALGGPVEIEFAVNLNIHNAKLAEFCLLQIRLMHSSKSDSPVDLDTVHTENILSHSHITLGDGCIGDIYNILYVKPDKFNPAKTVEIAAEIEKFNNSYGNGKPYILMGPGRWGSADSWLGIPVRWDQISNAKVIVEVGLSKFNIDPSFGSHFFQIVTGLKIAYFTINPKNKLDSLDWDWLERQPKLDETEYISWIRTGRPLLANVDGLSGEGIILKPMIGEVSSEEMDEQDSTGI